MSRAPLVSLVSLIAVGCVPMPMTRPPVATETSCECAPVTRLGRWTAEGVRRVPQGSVAASGVHVIVHGWAPGWHGHVERGERSWQATRNGERFDPWMHDLAASIQRRDPDATVLFYSWLDDAATTDNVFAQRRAFARTHLHGGLLAESLGAALRDDFHAAGGEVHLIGHSFGARVATIAATRLSPHPQHLTLLDAPDGGLSSLTSTRVALADLLRQLPIGRGPGRVFVDNYISQLGVEYRYQEGLAHVLDVHTAPPFGLFDVGRRHVYAASFYARSADRAIGVAWSPLLGEPPAAGCFRQPFGELAVDLGCR